MAFKDHHVCDTDIEIIKFVINWSVELTIPADRQENIQVTRKSVALSCL